MPYRAVPCRAMPCRARVWPIDPIRSRHTVYPLLFPRFNSSQGVENGELTFSMIFKSDDTPYRVWVEPERLARYDKFFGPDVWAQVEKVDAQRRLVAIKLTTGQRPATSSQQAAAQVEEKADA